MRDETIQIFDSDFGQASNYLKVIFMWVPPMEMSSVISQFFVLGRPSNSKTFTAWPGRNEPNTRQLE